MQSLFYMAMFSLTNIKCQMFFSRVHNEFLINLLKVPNLYGEETFDPRNFVKGNLVVQEGLYFRSFCDHTLEIQCVFPVNLLKNFQ